MVVRVSGEGRWALGSSSNYYKKKKKGSRMPAIMMHVYDKYLLPLFFKIVVLV